MVVSFALAAMSFSADAADRLPAKVGECTKTNIREIGERLEDGPTNKPIPLSGSYVEFADGLSQVSYEQEPEVDGSKVGDPVSICLIELPKDCPPGDNRGKIYKTVNLRTHKSWSLSDSEHVCGGA